MKIYLFSEVTDKLKVIIQYNKIRSTVFLIKFNKPGTVYTDSINFPYKHKCDIFKETVYNNHYIDVDFLININE